ncbi:MAG: ferritin family protein [Bacteroidota bacterium]
MSRDRSLNWDTMSIRDILEFAIADEEEAREYYRHAAQLAVTPHTKLVLERLAEMEKGHAEALRAEISEMDAQRECETAMAD